MEMLVTIIMYPQNTEVYILFKKYLTFKSAYNLLNKTK